MSAIARPDPAGGASAPSPPPPARRRGAWWKLGAGVAASALLLAGGAYAVRWAGLRELRAVIARHRAEGLGALPEDAFAEAPRMAPEDRAALEALADRMFERLWNSPEDSPELHAWLCGAAPEPPPGVREWAEGLRADVEEWGALVASGRVVFHRVAGVVPPARGWTFIAIKNLRWLGLVSLSGPGTWRRIAAAIDGNADAHLDALDAEARACSRPGNSSDAWMATAVFRARDGAYLEACLRGRLSPRRAATWLAEEERAMALVPAGLRGDRLLAAGAMAADLLAGRQALPEPIDYPGVIVEVRPAWAEFDLWLQGPAECAAWLRQLAEAESAWRDLLRGDASAMGRWPADGGDPVVLGASSVALGNAIRHRAARAAVRLVLASRERGRLPANDGEFRAWLGADATVLDGSPLTVRLRYEHEGDGIVLIAPDPDAPVPNLPGLRQMVTTEREHRPTGPQAADAVGFMTSRFRLPLRPAAEDR